MNNRSSLGFLLLLLTVGSSLSNNNNNNSTNLTTKSTRTTTTTTTRLTSIAFNTTIVKHNNNNKSSASRAKHSYYTSRRFNEWTWLASHNSHLNWDDNGVISLASNQNMSIDMQLRHGVRAFMLDIDVKARCTSMERLFATCNCEGVCLCHGACSNDTTTNTIKDGFTVRPLDYALRKIVSFLMHNRNEIVTLFLEDYVTETRTLQDVFARVKHFNALVFNPYAAEWSVRVHGWPLIGDMIRANKRLLIVDDEQRGRHARKPPGFIRTRDFIVANHYEWNDEDTSTWLVSLANASHFIPSDYLVNNNNQCQASSSGNQTVRMSRCQSVHTTTNRVPDWDETRPLVANRTESSPFALRNADKLFLFNHFYGVAANEYSIDPLTLHLMNKREYVMRRLREKCDPATGRKRPNYIALDFIGSNTYKDIVEPLNQQSATY